jgi:hypothetical protein
MSNLESPFCQIAGNASTSALQKVCDKNFTQTCMDRRSELPQSMVDSYCTNNLETPFCQIPSNISTGALQQVCDKNFTSTCGARKSELPQSMIDTYCAANPNDKICPTTFTSVLGNISTLFSSEPTPNQITNATTIAAPSITSTPNIIPLSAGTVPPSINMTYIYIFIVVIILAIIGVSVGGGSVFGGAIGDDPLDSGIASISRN